MTFVSVTLRRPTSRPNASLTITNRRVIIAPYSKCVSARVSEALSYDAARNEKTEVIIASERAFAIDEIYVRALDCTVIRRSSLVRAPNSCNDVNYVIFAAVSY